MSPNYQHRINSPLNIIYKKVFFYSQVIGFLAVGVKVEIAC